MIQRWGLVFGAESLTKERNTRFGRAEGSNGGRHMVGRKVRGFQAGKLCPNLHSLTKRGKEMCPNFKMDSSIMKESHGEYFDFTRLID